MFSLLQNIDKIHTTPLGVERIKHNLKLSSDPVAWCKEFILQSSVSRRGKNYYCQKGGVCVVINASSFTIITAHLLKK